MAEINEKYYNDDRWVCDVKFINHDQGFNLASQAVVQIVIQENILDKFNLVQGTLTFINFNEVLEDQGLYTFRMDGRDELHIKLYPKDPTEKIPDVDEKYSDHPEIWNFEYKCIIYDTEDIPSNLNTNKMKKLYFYDKRYQMMQDKKIFWSTATAEKREDKLEDPASASDDERSMFTGDAIKALLSDPLVGYEADIDVNTWDKGNGKKFYTSSTQYSVFDDLCELIDDHVSSENRTPCFLFVDRDNQFKLRSIDDFFDQAGKESKNPGVLQLEHLFFEDALSDTKKPRIIYSPISVDGKNLLSRDIKLGVGGKISSYRFVDQSGIDNASNMVSRPVYYYDLKNKQMGLDYEDHEIEKVRTDYKEIFTNKLFPLNKTYPILPLNKTKIDQHNIYPISIYNDSDQKRISDGKNKTFLSTLLLNEQIVIDLKGSSHRKPGIFIGIDYIGYRDSKFAYKICGQWFVTKVKHVFENNKYANRITAVKSHSYDDLEIEEVEVE